MERDKEYICSQLSAGFAGKLVGTHYPLCGPIQCRFFVSGLHDNYLIEDTGGKYILRVYRNDWRSPDDAQFELELLAFLHQHNAPVAGPVRTTAGNLAFTVQCPEGTRLAALFPFAAGRAPEGEITAAQCKLLGRAVADVHRISESFTTSHARPILDVAELVDEPMALAEPYLDADARAFLKALQSQLHGVLPGLDREPGVYGICTGDINARNFHITDDNQITLFDFDQCGYGYRAFELGKFASAIHHHPSRRDLLDAFIDGYQQVRPLSDAERRAIPYFEMAAIIWVFGIAVKNAERIGYKLLEKVYWDRKLKILRELHAACFHPRRPPGGRA